MTSEILKISDGTFTFSETEKENEYNFYRNDGEILLDFEDELRDLYHYYIIQKMMSDGSINSFEVCLSQELSEDQKNVKIVIHNSKTECRNSSSKKQPNLLKRLLHKAFG